MIIPLSYVFWELDRMLFSHKNGGKSTGARYRWPCGVCKGAQASTRMQGGKENTAQAHNEHKHTANKRDKETPTNTKQQQTTTKKQTNAHDTRHKAHHTKPTFTGSHIRYPASAT
mmetsp:Transcript_2601/g.6259  ORF Transcript_2601/g.6259 Transcript_2601/m.6259 type:complete len:115 (-) Transcript_2601:1453-1797(-)